MYIKGKFLRTILFLALAGLLAACSLPGGTPEVVVTYLGTSTPVPTAPHRDDCLEGEWIMPTHSLDLLIATMFPETSSYMRIIAGKLTMTFADGVFTYAGDYMMHVDSGTAGQYSEAEAAFSASGAYSTRPGGLIFDTTTSEMHMVSCTAYKDGMSFSVPCGSVQQISLLPPSEAPYRCIANQLEIDILSPRGTIITMFFER